MVRAYGMRPDSLEVQLSIRSADRYLWRDTTFSELYFFPEPVEWYSAEQRESHVRRILEGYTAPRSLKIPSLEVVDPYTVKSELDVSDSAADSIIEGVLQSTPYIYEYTTAGEGAVRIAWSVPLSRFITVGLCC